jgi:hypothetical protein
MLIYAVAGFELRSLGALEPKAIVRPFTNTCIRAR